MYEIYMEQSLKANERSLELYYEGDLKLSKFYKNVSIGFKIKALNLPVDAV